MGSSDKDVKKQINSDKMHNQNCHRYIIHLNIPEYVFNQLPYTMRAQLKEVAEQTEYDPKFPYADLYTSILSYVEDNLDTLYDEKRKEILLNDARIEHYDSPESVRSRAEHPEFDSFSRRARAAWDIKRMELAKEVSVQELDDFILSFYLNDNRNTDHTYESIKHLTSTKTPIASDLEHAIAKESADSSEKVNTETQSPTQAGSNYGRFTAMISDNFKPQQTTRLATIKHNRFNEGRTPQELSIGTQGQRHEGKERVSPLWERYINIQAEKATPERPITHIYFNNLGRDRTDPEGKKESKLTHQLEQMGQPIPNAPPPNIAVITLPADKGLMSGSDYKQLKATHNKEDVRQIFFEIATQDETSKHKIKDFFISQSVRNLLFKNEQGKYSKQVEEDKINELLDKSFDAVGVRDKATLSSAERQAVWFHFNKFELTNYIIETLQPDTINFSCKDGIDRGGVSSAYYNLVKSFEPDSPFPLNREEFESALHAAPTMVKGRGMNHHANLIWNTVDALVTKNYATLKDDPERAWLIEWRDFNCPHARVKNLLNQRVEQITDELLDAKENAVQAGDDTQAIEKMLEIVTTVKNLEEASVSGKRLMLETIARIPALLSNPDKEQIEAYSKLAKKVSVFSAVGKVVGGLMESLVGILLYVPTFGKTKDLITKGWATAKAGYYSDELNDLERNMQELANMKESTVDTSTKEVDPETVKAQLNFKDRLRSITTSEKDLSEEMEHSAEDTQADSLVTNGMMH